jgi:23S rRNA pseudouridine2604 synthase
MAHIMPAAPAPRITTSKRSIGGLLAGLRPGRHGLKGRGMAWTRRYDEPEPQRVNRWLAQSGVCSRREAEALIGRGLVSIDGARVDDPGRKIEAGQTLTLADAAETELGASLTAVINKPEGVVSGQPEGRQVPAVRLLTREALVGEAPSIPGRDASLAPLGRLDMDSRGLLLLSEDGVLAKAVIGPDSLLDKEYLVRVAGALTEAKLARLRHGLSLDGRELKRAGVEVISPPRLRFVLTEGRNRQIRRMCELVELTVTDLFRVRIGPLRLGDLPEGRWRALAPEERAGLIAASTGRG